jgi:tRNA uridine 5-carboxymethylaminomethyl modification enzyme
VKQKLMAEARAFAMANAVTPAQAAKAGLSLNQDGRRRSVMELLAHPGVSRRDLARIWPTLGDLRPDIGEQLEIEALYAGYLDRQDADIIAFQKDEDVRLPSGISYSAIPALSHEARARLEAAQPATLGQAGRIEGVTPAALAVLSAWLRKNSPAA